MEEGQEIEMSIFKIATCGLGLALVLAANTGIADEFDRRAIPRTYISPGASGSIETQQRSQHYNLYGGQAVPRGTVREYRSHSSGQYEQRGSIRQSTEYPGGIEIERTPGSTTNRLERRQ
ncbi:hypothetical protein SAMN05216409_106199 [Pseudomonas lutea]|uniref:Uncharacterized protein n=2 Tax=Pseudomonas TaxID=286 RepID=A0A9X8MCS0_9PSED|nr:hypothetical protein SAMN05216409_106199 [Pseudomonas lutea]